MRTSRTPRPDPYEYAETLGINIVWEPLEGGVNGLWVPEHRTVVLNTGMDEIKERCVLAHELAHFVLGHDESTPLNEWQADRYASTHQIARDEFLKWWPKCGSVDDLAFELGVTRKLVLAYISLIEPRRFPVAVAA